jgi:hypothetical protein
VARYLTLGACLFLGLASPAHADSPTLPMQVIVHPNPMHGDTTHEYVKVVTQPRIVCVAFVLFDNGRLPLSFPHAETKVTTYGGVAEWDWSDRPAADGGTASVSCNNSVATRTVNVHFHVLSSPRRPNPTARRAPAQFAVRALVSPNPIPSTSYFATLSATTTAGARCVAGVFYNDGIPAQSFAGYPQTARGGKVSWHWHAATGSGGGTATVTCSLHGRSLVSTAVFAVKRS